MTDIVVPANQQGVHFGRVGDQFRKVDSAGHQVKDANIVHQPGKHGLIAIDAGRFGQYAAQRGHIGGVFPKPARRGIEHLHLLGFKQLFHGNGKEMVRTASMPTRRMALLTSAISRPDGLSATEFAMRMILALMSGSTPTSLAS